MSISVVIDIPNSYGSHGSIGLHEDSPEINEAIEQINYSFVFTSERVRTHKAIEIRRMMADAQTLPLVSLG